MTDMIAGYVLGDDDVYWCTLCGALHTHTQGSGEYIMATAFRTIGGVNYNIGFCNGTHSKVGQSKLPKEMPA